MDVARDRGRTVWSDGAMRGRAPGGDERSRGNREDQRDLQRPTHHASILIVLRGHV